MAGYRRFVAYVYEYPDGKKGDGKGFIKVEVRDGRCRMNYRVTGMRGRESVPCKIYGFVRLDRGCEGVLLGDCDLAGDSVQFQQDMPEQQLGGSHYSLNDLSGVIMLTQDGMMYGTGWDDKPVRLDEIRIPSERTREDTYAGNEMTREPETEAYTPEEPSLESPVPDGSPAYENGKNEEEEVLAAEPQEVVREENNEEGDWPFIEDSMLSRDEEENTPEEENQTEQDEQEKQNTEEQNRAEQDYQEAQNEPEGDMHTESEVYGEPQYTIENDAEEAWEEVSETEAGVKEETGWEETGNEENGGDSEPKMDAPWEDRGISVGKSIEQDDMAFHGNYAGEMNRPEPEYKEEEPFPDNRANNSQEDDSTWNPAGEGQEGGPDILEELDQDEDAIRHMRRVQREEEERTQSPAMENQVRGQEAQTARAGFYPFTDGEIVDCIQITPGDFRILSHRDRGLMNNNFLRHGYYRYHHVLLGKRREDGRYILGVPGVYNRQECLMAGMFGFPNFKAGKGSGPHRFGYWFRLIDTPNMDRGNRL